MPNLAGLVYGTILAATLLSAESAVRETYPRTMGAVLVALAAYWLSLSYARFTGGRLERGEPFDYRALARSAGHELTVLLGAAVPVVALLVSWIAGASLSTGVTVAVWCSVAAIIAIEIVIGVRSELTGRLLVVQSALGCVLGLMVIAIRVLLH